MGIFRTLGQNITKERKGKERIKLHEIPSVFLFLNIL